MGGKSDAPAAPDYIGQANATAAGNLQAARAQTSANRIDQVTPYGSTKYTQGEGFDEEGYKRAMAQHEATLAAMGDPSNTAMQQYVAAGGKAPAAPSRDQFITNPDHWSSQIELSDTGRQLLDASNRSALGMAGLQDTAMDRVRGALDQPFDTSGLIDINDRTGMDAWDRATDLIRQRQNPELDRQQSALDTKLANQGLTVGSEGWGTQQQQFGKTRNDADIAAQMAGLQAQQQFFGQAVQGNQATLQQRNFLRNVPLNELNALRTGAQVQNPTFSTPGMQGQTSGPDLAGASGQQYSAAVGQTNAANAQTTSSTQAGIGAAASIAAMFMY